LGKDERLHHLDICSLFVFYYVVIFIGGVAFSISQAIIPIEEADNIKHIVEVNI
jgi:hypothetical protein